MAMDYFPNAAFGLHIVRTPNDVPEWDLIRPRDRSTTRRTRKDGNHRRR